MTHTTQLLLVAAVMFIIGLSVGYLIVRRHIIKRSEIVNRKILENTKALVDNNYKAAHEEVQKLSQELEAAKVWITDAEIYMEELELENLSLSGTKSRAIITPPEEGIITKEKKVVHKRARKAK